MWLLGYCIKDDQRNLQAKLVVLSNPSELAATLDGPTFEMPQLTMIFVTTKTIMVCL